MSRRAGRLARELERDGFAGSRVQGRSATWPHALVRLPSGKFYFGQFKGQTVEGIEIPTWGERTCGDYDTAPDPSFIDNPINDIGVYKGRLFFLADENIILSRTRSSSSSSLKR